MNSLKLSSTKRCLPQAGRSAGFSIVSAVFLLVVLAVLGAAMLNISTVQHTSSAMDVQGARAYQAARAGVEWGLYRQLRDGACDAETSFELPAGSTLSQFTVTVACTHTAGAVAALDRYQIVATACNQPAAASPRCPNASASTDYVQRVVQVEF